MFRLLASFSAVMFSLIVTLQEDVLINKHSGQEEVVLNDSLTIDITRSKVIWKGKALGIFNHSGTVDFSLAALQISNGNVLGGDFIVDLTTMTATDKNLKPKAGPKYEKLKEHLSSPEVFDVAAFPTALFNLDTIIGNEGFGELTVRMYSHKEHIENISITKDGEKIAIWGDLTISRKSYDISLDSPFKDGILADDIKLKIMLIGK